jgi:hypothetical protein
MSLAGAEESMREVLASLRTKIVMSERGMSTRFQASSSRGVATSPSNAPAGTSRAGAELRTKHRNDVANANIVPTILLVYIPPLSGDINRDSVPRDFEYTIVTAYLPKGVRTYHADQDKVTSLKFCDFNLGDCKAYNMLAPFKYLTRTKVHNSKIFPQQWMMNLAQSTLLNIMKIPHFGRHQEVTACVKFLLARYHRGYLWLNLCITIDPVLINRVTMIIIQGPNPHEYYPENTTDHALSQNIKEAYGNVEKGTRGYKVASI